jgi:hypothetical protein
MTEEVTPVITRSPSILKFLGQANGTPVRLIEKNKVFGEQAFWAR